MNVFKKVTAAFMAFFMLAMTPVIANAAVIDESKKKQITDELFEDYWYEGFYIKYWQYTKSKVIIEHNPLASMTYMMIEAEVEGSNETSLQELSEGNITITEFYKQNEEFDFEKAKQKDKFKNSLIVGYDCSISGYRYGTWEFHYNNDDYTQIFGYFKEDSENFTLYEEKTNKVLGVYPRLVGYDYLDDYNDDTITRNGGGNDGSVGGGNSGGANSKNGDISNNTDNIDNIPDGALTVSSANSSSRVESHKQNNSGDRAAKSDDNIKDIPDVQNPAVTPEIVSTVD